ncbi:SRPBCC family protein [Seonamhaeicola marinus]|uniref:SRPBCC domain-containing protein n=1 Tax=Seonamhaeicola marinus TaxID=1912246 RepID=A0A5D0HS01_9FLAO|nr:SRPBCC domain-containing protein [Seonamhaeicola marinus]TYA74025.1 SRPBCC domain-containing protein [Seonamhaeicola marinus]
MKNRDKLIKKIEINAKLSQVWETVTDPKNVKKYLFEIDKVSKWKTNSQIPFPIEESHSGSFLEIETDKTLKFSSSLGLDGLVSIVTYQFSHSNENTILKVTQEGFENEEKRKNTENNWEIILNRIKEMAIANNV